MREILASLSLLALAADASKTGKVILYLTPSILIENNLLKHDNVKLFQRFF